jgi:crotonobetainyl-CoA:carnitine CoA-transferase CaiB-like acyl-CoA transferase
VFCHVSSYGPVGPRADWPGYDQLYQASAGWEYEGAGEGNPPMWHRFGMMDHQGAMASLVATLLALIERGRTGLGSSVNSSILGASVLTMSETHVQPDGTLAPYDRLDAEQTGIDPGYRMYQAADGWVMISALAPGALDRLAANLGAEDTGKLEASIAGQESAEVVDAAAEAGVVAEVVRLDQLQSFLDDPGNDQAGLVARYHHPTWGLLEQIGALWQFGHRELRIERPPPILGQHTREVLAEVGLDPAAVETLVTSGVAVDAGV